MPTSLDTFNDVFRQHLLKISPHRILDVGAGEGKYGLMARQLVPHAEIEAIEPSAQYAQLHRAQGIYNRVFECTMQEFVEPHCRARYNMIICGDVMEHLFRSQVIDYLDFFLYRCNWVVVAWPTNMPQDDEDQSSYEIHKSNFTVRDLTNHFELHHYERRFAWYQGMGFNDPEFCHSEHHYAILKGYVTKKSESL